MGLPGTLCGIFLIALTGVHLSEGGAPSDTCATPEKVAEINAKVDAFQASIDVIMNSGGSEMERHAKVFSLACQNATYKAQVNVLSLEISNCLQLVASTKLPTLSFGPITFIQLMSKFPTGGFVEFCQCSPFLPSAMALEKLMGSYTLVVPNGEYDTVGNLPFYCAERMVIGSNTMNIRAMLTDSLKGLDGGCENVYTLAGMGSKTMATTVRGFLSKCPTFDAAGFQCALTKSATAEFKTCMNNAVGDGASCTKYACVKKHMMPDSECGASGSESYMMAVNIHKGMEELGMKKDSECSNNAGVPHVSLMAVLGSLLLAVLL